jgi:hypothetical protein
MKHSSLIVAAMPLTGCQQHHAPHVVDHPAKVEAMKDLGVNRVTMTEKAIARIDLKTDSVREQRVSRSASPRKVVPHSALIYDPKGQAWVYTSPEPRMFIKRKVDVDYVEGNLAVLNDGPPAGTSVVSRAAAEVYGADSGVGH